MFKNLKIKAKISIVAGLVFTLAYIVVFSIVFSNIYSNSQSQAESLAKSQSISYAKDVNGNLNVIQSVASGLENSIVNNKNSGFIDRTEVIQIAKGYFKKIFLYIWCYSCI